MEQSREVSPLNANRKLLLDPISLGIIKETELEKAEKERYSPAEV